MSIRRGWLRAAGAAAFGAAVVAACAQSKDTRVVVEYEDDDAAAGAAGGGGVAGSAASGGVGATGGTAATGGTSGGNGGTGGAAAESGAGGADASMGGSGAFPGGGAGGVVDAGSDVVDYDSSGPCEPNTIQTKRCGACGEQSRLCDSTGTYLNWGECAAEVGECVPGTTREDPCGMCGTITWNCSGACVWLPGPCENQGVCQAGELSVSNASCSTGQLRASTCTDQCQPGSWSDCSDQYVWQGMALAPIDGRREYSFLALGDLFVVVGGYGSSPTYKNSIGIYDPQGDVWAQAPWPSDFTGREHPIIAYAAPELLIWGGYGSGAKGDGMRIDLGFGTPTPISTTGAPSARYSSAYAWDEVGGELIIWGGYGSSPSYKDDGFGYKPSTDTWRQLNPPPIPERRDPQFAWDAAARKLYVWGGYNGSELDDGAVYDAAAGTWAALPTAPINGRRYGAAVVASGKFIVFGGKRGSEALKDGAIYDPTAGTWTLLPDAPIAGRYDLLGLSDGSRAFFWGGRRTTSDLWGDGAIYDPAGGSWQGVPGGALAKAPSPRYSLGGLWSPTHGIIVWGGDDGSYADDGAIYVP